MTTLVDRVAPRTRAVLESAALMAPALFKNITSWFSIDDRRKLFHDDAARFYRL